MMYKQKDFVKVKVDGKFYFIFYVLEDLIIYVGIEVKQRLNWYDFSIDKGFEYIVLDSYFVFVFMDVVIESQFVFCVDCFQFYEIIEVLLEFLSEDVIYIFEGVDKVLLVFKNYLRLKVQQEMKDQDFCRLGVDISRFDYVVDY